MSVAPVIALTPAIACSNSMTVWVAPFRAFHKLLVNAPANLLAAFAKALNLNPNEPSAFDHVAVVSFAFLRFSSTSLNVLFFSF